MGRTLYPQVFTQIAHVRRHLESNDYTAFGGVVLIRLDIDSGFKNYLIATAETCKACNQILHHAVGVEVYCSNPRCPDAIESFI